MVKAKHINLGNFSIGNNLPFTLIAGPCQMESREHALDIAKQLVDITSKLNINLVYKSSFDKANRTSLNSKRGIGLENALPIFAEIKEKFKIPVLTDIHNQDQCKIVSKVVDIIQIPAFLCRQTDLLVEAAKTDAIINVKKGQFLAPWDMKNVVSKVKESGNDKILVTDRGTCFGYNALMADMRSLSIMGEEGYPVIFDATHSVQQPGGLGGASAGQRQFVPVLAKAAIAVGIAAVFMETHQDPDNAPSDGPCMVPLNEMSNLLKQLQAIDNVVKNF